MPDKLLMCTPQGFAVNYEINPWMTHQTGHVLHELAISQWQLLYETLSSLAEIELMQGNPQWPDLVFTANAGLPLAGEKTFILSNFKYPERQGEKAIDRAWFETAGWTCIDLPEEVFFEGAGDALFDTDGRLWAGCGPRSGETAAAQLARYIETPIHRLALINPRYYHLDTCFCPLSSGHALYLPEAFDSDARELLARHFGSRLIALTPDEGLQFCANAVCVGHTVVMNRATPRLANLLGDIGYAVQETPLSEFMKSGGGAKCLTLSLAGWVNGQV